MSDLDTLRVPSAFEVFGMRPAGSGAMAVDRLADPVRRGKVSWTAVV